MSGGAIKLCLGLYFLEGVSFVSYFHVDLMVRGFKLMDSKPLVPFGLGTDLVRTVLPSIIPPSYRGATFRYLYYIRCMLSGQSLVLENGHSHEESSTDFAELVSFLICHNSCHNP
ncbi:hypothetical protein RHGRI_017472 [Rhododendron griersonianum]|uniref:Uncharacterized protein n=1 Tax=Rhododendron griersonianum TaxID=479676 RepID=A0AAV6JXW0_9ERIC|nr:hypothetical protein RHGRI_017472 [Rhododendron griersonianum]